MATYYVYNIPSDETVNLRKTASTSGEILVRVGYGQAVEASPSATNGWHNASYGGHNGFIMSKYLTSSLGNNYLGTGTVIGGALYCRKMPESGYEHWGRFSEGTIIPIYSCSTSGWYETRWPADGSNVGYVMTQFVSMSNGGNSGSGSTGGTAGNTATWAQVLSGSAVYKKESSNSAVCEGVKTLQTLLKNIGYGENNVGNIVVDGNFGTITENAVKYFQAECGLSDDGVVGKETANKLEEVQTDAIFTNVNYYPLKSSLFKYDTYPYDEKSLVARIICAEHGYEGSGHWEARVGVAKVLKNRKDNGGVTLYNSSHPRTFKNIIFGRNQYTTAGSAMAYRVKRGSIAFEQSVTYATIICNGATPAGAADVTDQLFQKGYSADNSTYQSKPDYCKYPKSATTKYSFFYNEN